MERGAELANIMLRVHMPTGEEEIIINPNVAEKMAYIDQTYDENLVHNTCRDIYIHWARFNEDVTVDPDKLFDIGDAITCMEDGYKVMRDGWNGKGMWVRLVERIEPSEGDDGMANLPYLEMKTADDKLIPWVASQTDLLAKDWRIFEE